jgi:hypothetical protein
LFDPDSNRNFFLEGDEDDLVEKLIELLDDPAKCDVMEENPRQVIDSALIAIRSLPAFDLRLRSVTAGSQENHIACLQDPARQIFLVR